MIAATLERKPTSGATAPIKTGIRRWEFPRPRRKIRQIESRTGRTFPFDDRRVKIVSVPAKEEFDVTQLQITDPELMARLQAKNPVDVVDAAGRVVGRVAFEATDDPEFDLSDEELERLENDPNAVWFTADEVVARLQGLLGRGR